MSNRKKGRKLDERTGSGNSPFRLHWEHRKKGKPIWYLCAAPPEVTKPGEGTCDVPGMSRHRVAHRRQICECGLVTYAEAIKAAAKAREANLARRSSSRSRRRIPVPEALKRAIRLRAGNRCEDCGRPLQAVYEIEYPEQWTDRVELAVYRHYHCRRCGFLFPVVDAGWLQDGDLGRRIQERFPAFYPDSSKTYGGSYWANHCPACQALQGGFYVEEYGIGRDPDETLVIAPWKPVKTEDGYVTRESIEWGHVHHLDGDPANNAPSNLRLVCVQCHANRHGLESRRRSKKASARDTS